MIPFLTYLFNLFVLNVQVDENMQRAQRRNACLSEKFWWRRDVGAPTDLAKQTRDPSELYAEMTIDEIVNGKVRRNTPSTRIFA